MSCDVGEATESLENELAHRSQVKKPFSIVYMEFYKICMPSIFLVNKFVNFE